jgi:hypothetical protein
MRAIFYALLLIAAACVNTEASHHAVPDARSAIRIGIAACLSSNAAERAQPAMRASLRGRRWHVWQQGRACEVFSTDVDAVTGAAGPCSICVT